MKVIELIHNGINNYFFLKRIRMSSKEFDAFIDYKINGPKELNRMREALRYSVNSLENANAAFDVDSDDLEVMSDWIKATREEFKIT